VTVAITAVLVALPIYAGTNSYPIAIVQGNSMYPTLQNGDLVIFHAVPQQTIQNGTIIVFVQGTTGVSLIDQLLRPVLIHRVVGVVLQSDGLVNYQTKGDNNQQDDAGLTPSYNVMGTPVAVIPKVGLLFLFIQSPQGLVAVVSIITLLYVGKTEGKMDEERKKNDLLGTLARAALNDEIPVSLFGRLELAVRYGRKLPEGSIGDDQINGLSNWIRNGGLRGEWDLKREACPRCGAPVLGLEAKTGSFVFDHDCRSSIESRVSHAASLPSTALPARVQSSVPLGKERLDERGPTNHLVDSC
jgi:signal peptidase I